MSPGVGLEPQGGVGIAGRALKIPSSSLEGLPTGDRVRGARESHVECRLRSPEIVWDSAQAAFAHRL